MIGGSRTIDVEEWRVYMAANIDADLAQASSPQQEARIFLKLRISTRPNLILWCVAFLCALTRLNVHLRVYVCGSG